VVTFVQILLGIFWFVALLVAGAGFFGGSFILAEELDWDVDIWHHAAIVLGSAVVLAALATVALNAIGPLDDSCSSSRPCVVYEPEGAA